MDYRLVDIDAIKCKAYRTTQVGDEHIPFFDFDIVIRLLNTADKVDLEKLKSENEALSKWKREAMAVESEWDIQAVAKVLGIGPGESVRKNILPAIIRLIDNQKAND